MPFADKEAQKEYKRQYYQANKAILAEKSKVYRQQNADAVLERKKRWESQNKEKVAAAKRAWAERNPGRKREYYARPEVQARQRAAGRAFYEANKGRVLEASKVWREQNSERKRSADRASHIRRKYGITPEQYDAMLASQDYKCATCGVKDGECGGPGNRLAVDHMHCSGKIRALLCSKCNSAIGLLRENADFADAIASHIRKHQAH